MGDYLHKLIDVPIVYPDGTPSFWEFLSGQCKSVEFIVNHYDIPQEVLVDDDIERRSALVSWIKSIWLSKDRLIDDLLRSP